MLHHLTVLLLALVLLVASADAAFRSARHIKPTGMGTDGGDHRYLLQKLHRRKRELFDNEDGMKDLEKKHKCKSRSYHFKWGPRFPESHPHLEEQHFSPGPHQSYY